jgi:hypothetical protein
MPVNSKSEQFVFGEGKFRKVISCDSKGVFKITLPRTWHSVLGFKEVTGGTLKEAEKAFDAAHETMKSIQNTTRKVIIHKVDNSVSFAKGAVIAVCASVFEETKSVSGDVERFIYEEVASAIPWSLKQDARNLVRNYGDQVLGMEWTEERELFFVKLGEAVDKVRELLALLQDKNLAIEIADGRKPFNIGVNLLPNHEPTGLSADH